MTRLGCPPGRGAGALSPPGWLSLDLPTDAPVSMSRYATLGTDLIDIVLVHWYPGMPTVIGGEIQLTTIMIIAICGFTAVIVAFLVYRYVKGKKSIVQRLGE